MNRGSVCRVQEIFGAIMRTSIILACAWGAAVLGTAFVCGCEEPHETPQELSALEMCYYADQRCGELTAAECQSIDKCGICNCGNTPCVNECTPGAAICNGNVVLRCAASADGCFHWGVNETCPNACVNGACTCANGNCADPNACSPGAMQCSGNFVQQCQMSGSSYQWVNQDNCPHGCVNGACIAEPGECSPGAAQCSGNTVQQCKLGGNGAYQWVDAGDCPNGCENGACVACLDGNYTCHGKTLKKCASKKWQTVKTCQSFCNASGTNGGCTEDLPACKMKPGAKFLIRQWTDGDTLWIVPKADGTCNDQEYSADDDGKYAWRDIRFDVRVEGIDAPECTKAQNTYFYYTCTKDTRYTNDNERMGYESWARADAMLPFKSEIIVSCEKTLNDGSCGYDATRHRRLAYIGYERNNASYDFATELAREGLAFANVEFASTTNKIGEICAAQKEAISAKRGLWSLSSNVNGVLNMMGKDKQKNLKNLESRCNSLMK